MVDPVIGAAALTVLGGLMSSMLQREQAQKESEKAAKIAERARQDALARDARDRVAAAQQNQLSTIRGMGDGEQDAIGQLMAAIGRTAR